MTCRWIRGRTPPPDRRYVRLTVLVREAVLMSGLFLTYQLGRLLADDSPGPAMKRAADLWSLERWLHLPNELDWQAAVLDLGAIQVANHYYAWVHFPAIAAFLAWVYFWHREIYPRIRAILALTTAMALAMQLAYPLAPPRLLDDLGLVDTGQVFGPDVYTDSAVANEYAAMPSIHIGWAVLEAWGISRLGVLRWRSAAWLHPALTTVVVVVTANHFWLDGVVAVALLIVAIAMTGRLAMAGLPTNANDGTASSRGPGPASVPGREPDRQLDPQCGPFRVPPPERSSPPPAGPP